MSISRRVRNEAALICQVSGCGRQQNHSQLHNVIAALVEACDELERVDLDSLYPLVERLRGVADDAVRYGNSKVP